MNKNATAAPDTLSQRLTAFREVLETESLDGWVVYATDEHLNEYLADHKKRRQWLSNFTGSAGDVLITRKQAFLFTDSRYHTQAEQELDAALYTLVKSGLEAAKTLPETVKDLATGKASFRLGIPAFCLSVAEAERLKKTFAGTAVTVVFLTEHLVDRLWHPEHVSVPHPPFVLDEALCGNSTAHKVASIRQQLSELQADAMPVCKLDQVAWLLNARGLDIPYNPVFTANAWITPDAVSVFVPDPETFPAIEGVIVRPYSSFLETVLSDSQNGSLRVLIESSQVPAAIQQALVSQDSVMVEGKSKIVEGKSPLVKQKAIKTEAELAGMREANWKASKAKIRAMAWLDEQLEAKTPVSEAAFAKQLEAYYAEEEGFFCLSFNTIAGAGGNSAIVHYGTPDPNRFLTPGELFLIDSGAQYLSPTSCGTTDDTRTLLVAGSQASLEQKRLYTAVLQAHIDCAAQVFPKGTGGIQLDGITRSSLWREGLDFGHGTGHGVGAFLNVHEGPNGISRLTSEPLVPGMITSIEPGYYRPGWGGFRLENLYEVVPVESSEDPKEGPNEEAAILDESPWYAFQPLTWVPFDRRLIHRQQLSPAAQMWLSGYYETLQRKMEGHLPEEAWVWLLAACRG